MQTYNLFWRSVKWRFQNPVTIIMTLVQPLIWLLLFSTIFSGGKAEENYTAFILPGILVMGVLSSSGVSGIANYSLKTGGSFYRIMISPVRRLCYTCSYFRCRCPVIYPNCNFNGHRFSNVRTNCFRNKWNAFHGCIAVPGGGICGSCVLCHQPYAAR